MNNYEIMMNGNVKIGEYAPEFEAMTTMGNIKLSDYKGKWIILFSHPGDFTPVCTTEFIAFSKANTYFERLNTCLIGLSIDSNPSHLAWLYDICLKTGITVPFPVIADRSGEIARKYGMISNSVSSIETVRNVFVIDDKGIVRTIFIFFGKIEFIIRKADIYTSIISVGKFISINHFIIESLSRR